MSHRRGDYVTPKIEKPKATIPTLTRNSGQRRGSPVNQELDKMPVPEIDARYSITQQKKGDAKHKSGSGIKLKARTETTPKSMMAYSFTVEPLKGVKMDHPAVQWR